MLVVQLVTQSDDPISLVYQLVALPCGDSQASTEHVFLLNGSLFTNHCSEEIRSTERRSATYIPVEVEIGKYLKNTDNGISSEESRCVKLTYLPEDAVLHRAPESTSSGARVREEHVSMEHTVLNPSTDRIFV